MSSSMLRKRQRLEAGSREDNVMLAETAYSSNEDIYRIIDDLESNILKQRFGLDKLKDSQRVVLEKILRQQSCLAIFPTGYGKSLLYMLPAEIFSGLTIVVSPLLALMRDQVEYLRSKNVKAMRIDSSMSYEDVKSTIDELNSGRVKILYVSPERFNNEGFQRLVSKLQVSLFVVDEAHCISEWGHAFRPDYLRLSQFSLLTKAPIRLALTATATTRVSQDIIENLDISEANVVRLPSVRRNLKLQVLRLPSIESKVKIDETLYAQKRKVLLDLLAELEAKTSLGATIIYVNKHKAAIDLATELCAEGYTAKSYHGGMDTADREEVEAWFLGRNPMSQQSDTKSPIVVGTTAFGMGVDRGDIRHVIHFDIPRSVEDYIQGCGRAGRDGNNSTCTAFFNPCEVPSLRSQIYGSTPTHKQLTSLVEYILSPEANICKEDHGVMYLPIFKLSSELDVQDLSLRLALSHLVQKDILQEITSIYQTFKTGNVDSDAYAKYRSTLVSTVTNTVDDPLKPSMFATIIDNIVESIGKAFETFSARKKWIELDVFAIANERSCHPSLVISAINQLAQHQVISLHPSKPTESIYARYEFKRSRIDNEPDLQPSYTVNELSELIYRHALENQHRTLLRNDEIVSLLESVSTSTINDNQSVSIDIWDRIAQYFNESHDSSDALAAAVPRSSDEHISIFSEPQSSNANDIDESVWRNIVALVDNGSLSRDDPLLLARFAAGVISPKIFRMKLQRLDSFGCCMANDWLDIVQKCSELVHSR